MIGNEYKAAAAIQDAVRKETSRYFSLMEGELFWAAFKQAMAEYKMRDPDRIGRIIVKLQAAWQLAPDMRLGQLLVNLGGPEDDIYETEDDAWETQLDEFIARYRVE